MEKQNEPSHSLELGTRLLLVGMFQYPDGDAIAKRTPATFIVFTWKLLTTKNVQKNGVGLRLRSWNNTKCVHWAVTEVNNVRWVYMLKNSNALRWYWKFFRVTQADRLLILWLEGKLVSFHSVHNVLKIQTSSLEYFQKFKTTWNGLIPLHFDM